MKIINQIKYYIYTSRDKRRYKPFKNCSIPYPLFDPKRDVIEWVTYYKDYYNELTYDVRNNLLDALGNVANTGITYHFRANLYGCDEPDQKPKYRFITSHRHSFDEIIKELYDYPETFEIPNEFLDEYSTQELAFLIQIKKYLHLIDLKDYRSCEEILELDERWDEIHQKEHYNLKDWLFILSYDRKWKKANIKEKLERYNNSKAREYASYYQMHFDNDKIADAVMSGKKDYRIYVEYPFSSSKLNTKHLIINSQYDYLGIAVITSEKIIKFKDLKENMVDYKLAGFKSFKTYKNHLLKELQEDSEAFNFAFNEDSLIKYVNLQIIKKF